MTSLPLGMIIEALVAVLLLVTIGYCWLLNRRLMRLRADEQILRATISELMTATEIAERAILGLKATARDADETLGSHLREAHSLSSSLAEQIEEGEKIFSRISQIAEAARSASEERAAHQAAQQAVPAYAQQAHQPAPQQAHHQAQGYAGYGAGQPMQPQAHTQAPVMGQTHTPAMGQGGYPAGYGQPQAAPAYTQGYAPVAPAQPAAPAPRARDIRSAAVEATERLGRFRNRTGGAAA